jgi:hypothetical protein
MSVQPSFTLQAPSSIPDSTPHSAAAFAQEAAQLAQQRDAREMHYAVLHAKSASELSQLNALRDQLERELAQKELDIQRVQNAEQITEHERLRLQKEHERSIVEDSVRQRELEQAILTTTTRLSEQRAAELGQLEAQRQAAAIQQAQLSNLRSGQQTESSKLYNDLTAFEASVEQAERALAASAVSTTQRLNEVNSVHPLTYSAPTPMRRALDGVAPPGSVHQVAHSISPMGQQVVQTYA